jgi:predicted  nucleic acid-binding Zn-ribbon protein
MSVTEKLLRVFRADQQLGGLQSRLRAAEKFLDEQNRLLAQIQAKRNAVNAQVKQSQAIASDHEGEMARFDVKIETLREQMNNAKTNKEYKAFLTEMNTFKAEKSNAETAALEQMGKLDELKKQLAEFDGQTAEREKVQKVAADEREKREAEIKDRLNQLQKERDALVKDVPADVMAMYLDLTRRLGEDAMAAVQELDRRRHEYSCGACQMAIPVETVSSLIRGSAATSPPVRCVSCGCLLYIEKEVAERLQPGQAKRGGKKQAVPHEEL